MNSVTLRYTFVRSFLQIIQTFYAYSTLLIQDYLPRKYVFGVVIFVKFSLNCSVLSDRYKAANGNRKRLKLANINKLFAITPVCFQSCRTYVFNAMPWIAVTDPSTVRHVLLSNAKNYVRGQFGPIEAFQSVVGKTSLLLLNGDMHKNHRSIISPAFRQGNLKKLLPLMFQCSNRLVDHWNEELKDKSTMLVDIKKFMSNVTLNIIGLAAFGFDFECIGKKSALADGVQSIVEAQDILNQAVLQMFTTIFPSGTRLLKNSAKQYLKGIETTRQFLKHMVNEKIITIEEWKNSETSFLELVLG